MPKRYRVVHGSDEFTWELIFERDQGAWELLAESHERWKTPEGVEDEIKKLSSANRQVVRGRGGNVKPEMKNPRKPTGHRHPDD